MMDVALIGLGGWGRTLGRSIQRRSDKIRVRHAVTRTLSKAEGFAAELGVPLTDDYEAVLNDPAVQGVVLATPHSQHGAQVIAAAKAGKHVFVEKPLSMNAADAAAAIAATRSAGVVLALGHNRRFLPGWQAFRKAVLSGEMGEVLHVSANFSGPSGYRRAEGSWRLDPAESPAGGMTGKGVHMTDLMVDLLGPPCSATLRSFAQKIEGGGHDTTLVDIDFEGGATGHLATLTATPDMWRISAFCANGWIELSDHWTLTQRSLDGLTTVTKFPRMDIERAALEAFAEAASGGAAYPVTQEQAYANTALLEVIADLSRDAGRQGRTQKVPATPG